MGRGMRPALLPAAGCPLPLPARSREGGTLIFEGFRTGGASLAAHELAAGLAVLTGVLSPASGPADLA